MELLDLNEKIKNVIQDAKLRLSDANTTKIKFEPTELDIPIYGDKVRRFQVVSNLDQCLKVYKEWGYFYSSRAEGGPCNSDYEGQWTGIDPEKMPRLFTKFASKSQTGTGLGLFISKSFIEAHGGKIWAENNNNGKDATFGFTLPLAKYKE